MGNPVENWITVIYNEVNGDFSIFLAAGLDKNGALVAYPVEEGGKLSRCGKGLQRVCSALFRYGKRIETWVRPEKWMNAAATSATTFSAVPLWEAD